MNWRSILWLFVIALLLLGPMPASAQASGSSSVPPASPDEPDAWEFIVPGIDYAEFRLPGPVNVFVTRMDRDNPGLTIDSTIAMGSIASGRETVRNMAARYNGTINNWGETWGNRSRVVVAINGYFFDPSTGTPWRGQVQSGWYAKRFDDKHNGSGFAWTMDQNAFIGECVSHPAGKQLVEFDSGIVKYISSINVPIETDGLILYTPQYAATTPQNAGAVDLLVEMSRPTTIMPAPNSILGIVRGAYSGGVTPIPFDHVVLSATGNLGSVLKNLAEGSQVRISQTLRNFSETDCRTTINLDWTKTYASVGASFYFLKDGVVRSYAGDGQATSRAPRTAVAYNDDYIFFIVADGRNKGVSIGMNMQELGEFARDYLGAEYGAALDGGGSSTMVVNGVVKNNTDCNNNYCGYSAQTSANLGADEAGLTGAVSGHVDLIEETPDAYPEETSDGSSERMVANGLVMVAVEPRVTSIYFQEGETVLAQGTAQVRLGPGLNYGILSFVPADTQGVIVPHINRLNGVMATGKFWWKVQFGSVQGWVDQASLRHLVEPPLVPSLVIPVLPVHRIIQ